LFIEAIRARMCTEVKTMETARGVSAPEQPLAAATTSSETLAWVRMGRRK
jgi:hypothetical protein